MVFLTSIFVDIHDSPDENDVFCYLELLLAGFTKMHVFHMKVMF